MALGAYASESARGNVLNAIAHPNVVDPMAGITNAVTAARGIQDLRTQQFNLQQAQLQPGYQAMRMLAATNPNPTNDDINAALGGAARLGGNVDGVVQNLSDWTARGGKPADFVRAYALGGMSPENQAQFGVGTPADVNTGPSLVSGVRGGVLSSAPGQFTPSSSIQLGLTPGQATEFVTVQGPDGKPYQVPRGTVYGTGVPGGGGGAAGVGGGGGGGAAVGGGGAGVGGSALLPPGAPADVAAARIDQIGARESGNQNIPNRQGPGGSPISSASGPYQFLDSTWQQAAREYGIQNPTQRAMDTDPAIQRAVAIKYLQNHGEQPWAQSAPGGAGGGGGGGGPPATGPFIGATSAQPVTGGVAVQPAGGGGGPPVRPVSSGPMPQYDQTGRPIVQGGGGGGAGYGGGGGAGGAFPSGGGGSIPGVQRGPGGAPVLTPPSPWMGPIWEQSAKQYSADVDKEGGLAQRIQPWQSALSILKANSNLSTGPTSQQWSAWGSTLQQYGVSLPSMPGDTLTAYQELGKNLARGLLNSGAGSPTDMARLEAEASSPNINMVRDAIQQLSARQIGYERFQVARLEYFRSLHPNEDPDQYANQYRSQTNQWASKLDPVAFGADNMSDQDIANYMKGLSPAAQQNFRASVGEAAKLFPDFAKAGK